MKKIMAVGVLMLVLVPWQALGGENEQLEMAAVLVENQRLPEMFVELAEAFMETYFERYDTPAAATPTAENPLRKIFKEEVRLGEEELRLMLAEIYAAHFSENELKEIVNFFNAPAGRAWLEKRPLLETEGEKIGLEWSQLLTQRVLKKFEDQTGEKY